MATGVSLDRLVRKEVSLGAIRERQWPQDHIGLRPSLRSWTWRLTM
jgi:hypothetical protein